MPVNKASLDRLMRHIKAIAPKNLPAAIAMTGGAAYAVANLATTRQNLIKGGGRGNL